MTSDLGLAHNLSGLSIAAGSNHIYPGHVMADITYDRATPPTWDKFKAFFSKSFRKLIAFVNSIWNKIKQDLQY